MEDIHLMYGFAESNIAEARRVQKELLRKMQHMPQQQQQQQHYESPSPMTTMASAMVASMGPMGDVAAYGLHPGHPAAASHPGGGGPHPQSGPPQPPPPTGNHHGGGVTPTAAYHSAPSPHHHHHHHHLAHHAIAPPPPPPPHHLAHHAAAVAGTPPHNVPHHSAPPPPPPHPPPHHSPGPHMHHGAGTSPSSPFHHHAMPPPPPHPLPHSHPPQPPHPHSPLTHHPAASPPPHATRPYPDSATLAKMSYTSMLNLVNNAAVNTAMSAMGMPPGGGQGNALHHSAPPVALPGGLQGNPMPPPPHGAPPGPGGPAPGGAAGGLGGGGGSGSTGGPSPAAGGGGAGAAPQPPVPAEPPTLSVSRRDLFELIYAENANRERLVEHVLSVLRLNASPHHVQQYVKQEVSRFYSRCIARWKHSRRMRDRFLRMNAYWLAIDLRADDLVAAADRHLANTESRNFIAPQIEDDDAPSPPPPPKPKVEELKPRDYGDRSLRALGPMSFSEPPMPRLPRPRAPASSSSSSASASSHAAGAGPGRKLMSRRNAPVSYTPEQALDRLIVRARLKKRQYEIMRDYALSINCYIYPSFQAIQKVIRERAAAGIQVPVDPENEAEMDSE